MLNNRAQTREDIPMAELPRVIKRYHLFLAATGSDARKLEYAARRVYQGKEAEFFLARNIGTSAARIGRIGRIITQLETLQRKLRHVR